MLLIQPCLSILTLLLNLKETLSQNNNFIRPAFDSYFISESTIQKFGGSIAIYEIKDY